MNLRIGLFVFFIAGVISGTAVAGVNLKNGNFYISYTDLVAGSLTQIDIARTYNSKSTRLGWFGYGWGSDYETHLETTASGAIIIRENGSGAITDFEPVKKLNKYGTNLQKSIKKLVKEFIKANPDKDTNEDELTKKFETDKEYRQSYWRQVIKNGSVNPIIIAKDTKFVSGQRGLQYVTRTDTGYVRHYNDGKEEYFDNYGQITEIRFNNGNWIKLSYYPQDNQTFFTRSKIRQIKNNHGDIIFFFFGDRNTIERIVSNRQETTNFHYDKKRNLIFSKDTSGNSYVYRYDKNHNLLEVLYSDGLKMLITYEPETQFVKSVKTRDGSITKYEYESEKNDPDNHYWTLVTKKNYIDTGKVRWVALNLPLAFHKDARKAAQGALCAGDQGKFWEMRETLFENPKAIGVQHLPGYAQELSLDVEAFNACLDSDRHLAAIDKDAKDARGVKLTGTPSFIIGKSDSKEITGKVVIGAQPFKVFDSAIQQALEQKPTAQ